MKKITLFLLCTLLFNSTFTHNNIFEEVRTKNKEALKKRLENCENCATKDENGNNALHIAAQDNDTEIIDILTTTPVYSGWSDWLYAFIYAPTLPNIDETNNNGDTPLHCSIHNNNPTATKQLLQKGARMDIVNKENLSALFTAIKNDKPLFVPLFVAHKLDINYHRRNGETIFHYAIKEQKPQSIRYCAQETSLDNVPNKDDKTPTFLAIDTENFQLLNLLEKNLNKPAHNGVKPIHYATRNGKYNVLEYLLQKHISINEPDENGNPPIFYAVADNNETMLNHLLMRNADIHKRNRTGEDVLAIATKNKHLHLINVLTKKHGLDIDARDNKGQTSFMRSAMEYNYDAMKQLLQLGANIRITDENRENVLHKIARTGDVTAARITLEHDTSLLRDRNKDGLTPIAIAVQDKKYQRLVELLIRHKTDINIEDNEGFTPLHHACAHDNITAMITLQNHGAMLEKRTNRGNTVAHLAAQKGNLDTLRYCIERNSQFLLIRNNNNETPLIIAARRGHTESVAFLLRDKDFINKDIDNAIQHAQRSGNYITLQFLQEKKDERIHQCQSIIDMHQETMRLINENKNNLELLYKKDPLLFVKYLTYAPSRSTGYSGSDLYTMTETERNAIKNSYLQAQNNELSIKNSLNHDFINLTRQEQSAAERIRQESAAAKAMADRQQAELNRIAAQRQAERDRIAAQQYAADIAKNNERLVFDYAKGRVYPELVEGEDRQQQHVPAQGSGIQQNGERVYILEVEGNNVALSLPANHNLPPQEEDEIVAEQGECCLCLDTTTVERLRCTHCQKGSARTCDTCINQWIDTCKKDKKPVTCPMCNKTTLSEKLKQ